MNFSQNSTVLYPDSVINFAFGACIFLIFFGCFGNALTVFALLRSSSLRSTSTTVFIISLSLTDLLFCSFNLPLTALRYWFRKWVMGEFLCELFPFVFYMNVAASLYHIMTISVNRYVLIAHNAVYDKIYKKSVVAGMIAFCWCFPISLLIPTLAGKWGEFDYKPVTFSCTIVKIDGKSPKKLLLFVGVLPPCLVTILCYGLIFAKFRHSRAMMRQSIDHALTKTILIIFATFLACYGPLVVVNVVDPAEHFVPTLHVLASVLTWASATLNPVVYAAMNKRYRKAYKALLPKRLVDFLSIGWSQRSSELSTISAKSGFVVYDGEKVNIEC